MAGVTECWEHEELLSAYLDGELTASELDQVVAHLDGCEDCVATFRAIQAARTTVRLLPMIDLPPSVAAVLHLGDSLSAYLDGELAPGDARRVGDHLAGCTDCRAELRELDAARTAVRALPYLETDVVVPASARAGWTWRRLGIGAAAAAAAVAIVLTVNGGGPVAAVDRDELANRHTARTSVEQGFAVIPAFATPAEAP